MLNGKRWSMQCLRSNAHGEGEVSADWGEDLNVWWSREMFTDEQGICQDDLTGTALGLDNTLKKAYWFKKKKWYWSILIIIGEKIKAYRTYTHMLLLNDQFFQKQIETGRPGPILIVIGVCILWFQVGHNLSLKTPSLWTTIRYPVNKAHARLAVDNAARGT